MICIEHMTYWGYGFRNKVKIYVWYNLSSQLCLKILTLFTGISKLLSFPYSLKISRKWCYCYFHIEKRLQRSASTAAIMIVRLVVILVIIHCSHSFYCTVFITPLYHRIVYLKINFDKSVQQQYWPES